MHLWLCPSTGITFPFTGPHFSCRYSNICCLPRTGAWSLILSVLVSRRNRSNMSIQWRNFQEKLSPISVKLRLVFVNNRLDLGIPGTHILLRNYSQDPNTLHWVHHLFDSLVLDYQNWIWSWKWMIAHLISKKDWDTSHRKIYSGNGETNGSLPPHKSNPHTLYHL